MPLVRNTILTFFAFTVFCFAASSAQADTITVQLNSANGAQQGGYLVGPFSGTANGAAITMICIDFAHSQALGSEWTVNVNSFGDLSGARFGNMPNAVSLYEQAAWLASQFATVSPSGYGDIQFAIWNLFTDWAPDTAGSNAWMAMAQSQGAGVLSFSSSGFSVLTPAGGVGTQQIGTQQEFIFQAVPEPTSMFLLATGLAGVGAAIRKRRNNK